MNLPALLSFLCGFASLSLEILWVRIYGFANQSTPVAFGFVLAAYLAGVALGASAGARACAAIADERRLWRLSSLALLVSALFSLVLPMAFAALVHLGINNPMLDLLVLASASSALAYVFPMAHHLGTSKFPGQKGRRFSRVYTANVMGAALGPLFTGYVLLDAVSVQTAFLLLGALQAAGAACVLLACGLAPASRAVVAASAIVCGLCVAATHAGDPHELVQHLSVRHQRAKTVVENRHGIITIYEGGAGGDTVMGGNVYDGTTNLDPDRNTNQIQRPLLTRVLQPDPKRVLMIGLSIGSWLAIVREFPGVESIDVVEINPGYLEAARGYPPQTAALADPRVRIHIDDARRWLRHSGAGQYDLVIMNTTLHWRANASLLLSREMLTLVRQHMAPGAVMAFNATGSGDAFATAVNVFPYAFRYHNFVYAADFDFRARKDSAQAREAYASLQLGARPFFAAGSPAIGQFLGAPFVDVASDQAESVGHRFEVVTDDNLVTEFRRGRTLYYISDIFWFQRPVHP